MEKFILVEEIFLINLAGLWAWKREHQGVKTLQLSIDWSFLKKIYFIYWYKFNFIAKSEMENKRGNLALHAKY